MGQFDRCTLCDLPVLELNGQYEALQPYFLDDETEDAALESAGDVHSACLVHSPHRSTWTRARLKHYCSVRSYEVAAEIDGWTVLFMPRLGSTIALHADGPSLDIEKGARHRAVSGGAVVSFEREWNLSFENQEFVASIQTELVRDKRVLLASIVDELGIRAKLQWPGVLDAGCLRFVKSLRRYWTPTQISAQVCYQEFVPEPVFACWKELVA
jgi:hypothetical protein